MSDDASRYDLKSLVSLEPEGRSSLPKFLVILRAKMDTVGPSVGDVVRRLEVKCRCGKSFRFKYLSFGHPFLNIENDSYRNVV